MRTYHTEPNDCPKYSRCSAAICPLDPNWRLARQLPGERVCFFLREWSKRGGEARVAVVLLPNVVEAVAQAHRAITLAHRGQAMGWGDIRRSLARWADAGSKLAAGCAMSASNNQHRRFSQ